MTFSLIVPVYKVENYVAKCLLSCLNQNYNKTDYEIIVINDGSPDKSLEIVMRIIEGYQNVTIISQENKGLSAARNAGFKVAKGDYVWFIDSDDWIDISALKKLQMYCNENYDIITFCAANAIASDRFVVRKYKTDIDKKPTDGVALMNHPSWQPPVWLNVYRRDFLLDNHLVMLEGILHEDSEFEPKAYYYAKRAIALNEVLYYVRINMKSISRSVNPKRAFDLLIVSASLDDFSKSIDNTIARSKISEHICLCLNVAFSNYKLLERNDQQRFVDVLNKQKYLLANFQTSPIIKHKIQGLLFSMVCNVNFFIKIYNVLSR